MPPARALAADAYPSRPIHLMVGFTPGSSSDITGRVFASGASQILGQNIVVENKPGRRRQHCRGPWRARGP